VPKFDVTGIGNAIIDVIAPCEDSFLEKMKIQRGAMTLIDQERARELHAAMYSTTEVSGGSAANTMAGFASFGGKGGYIGLVAHDTLGNIFAHDIQAIGLTYHTPRYTSGLETARCYIFVTPDGERSMNTFLGASSELSEDQIDEDLITNSAFTYMEGYLFDKDPAKAGFKKAAKIAHNADRQVALTLSDSFCVNRHRSDFLDLIQNDIDILFANEDEVMALYQTDIFEDAIEMVRNQCAIATITRSRKGSVIICGNETIMTHAEPVTKIVDTTGAGDQYAAGFLYGLTRQRNLADCGRLGSLAAAEVISHIGSRPQISYTTLDKAA